MGLETVEIVLEIEDAFSISIPDDRANRVRTVGDLVELVRELVVAKRGNDARVMSIEPHVRLIVSDQLNIPLQRIASDSRFVEDLGCG